MKSWKIILFVILGSIFINLIFAHKTEAQIIIDMSPLYMGPTLPPVGPRASSYWTVPPAPYMNYLGGYASGLPYGGYGSYGTYPTYGAYDGYHYVGTGVPQLDPYGRPWSPMSGLPPMPNYSMTAMNPYYGYGSYSHGMGGMYLPPTNYVAPAVVSPTTQVVERVIVRETTPQPTTAQPPATTTPSTQAPSARATENETIRYGTIRSRFYVIPNVCSFSHRGRVDCHRMTTLTSEEIDIVRRRLHDIATREHWDLGFSVTAILNRTNDGNFRVEIRPNPLDERERPASIVGEGGTPELAMQNALDETSPAFIDANTSINVQTVNYSSRHQRD